MRREDGAALVIVLLAIVVLLPPTIVLSTLALRWQRQSLDFRDTLSEEFTAQAAFEEARNRIAGGNLDLAPNEASRFLVEDVGGLHAEARIAREDDIVLTLSGSILEGAAANRVDLGLTNVDGEGRVVYQFRKLEIYLVQTDVSRRPSLPTVRLYGVVARLPDGSIQTLGLEMERGFFE